MTSQQNTPSFDISALQKRIKPVSVVKGFEPVNETEQTSKIDARPADAVVAEQIDISLSGHSIYWFTLAPVYLTLRVNFDICEEFLKSKYGAGAEIHRYKVPFAVTPDIPGWENMLEAVDVKFEDNLKQFLKETGFTRTQQSGLPAAFNLELHEVQMVDAKHGKFTLGVFTPISDTHRVIPAVDASGAIRFSIVKFDSVNPQLNNFLKKGVK